MLDADVVGCPGKPIRLHIARNGGNQDVIGGSAGPVFFRSGIQFSGDVVEMAKF
jgi:hypothetical protein